MNHLSLTAAGVGLVACMLAGGAGAAQAAGFGLSSMGPIQVDAKATYYDGAGGAVLFSKVALPSGATALQFSVSGAACSFGTTMSSPDGLQANGVIPWAHSNTKFSGAYQGTPIGATTGDDPSLFGVFFSTSGAAIDSLDYRHNGVTPGLLTQAMFSPSLNQPFFIGDGYDQENRYGAAAAGQFQTFNIPTGAAYLLLGVGSDDNLADNSNPTGQSYAYLVQVYDNAVPEPAGLTLMAAVAGGGALLRRARRRGA